MPTKLISDEFHEFLVFDDISMSQYCVKKLTVGYDFNLITAVYRSTRPSGQRILRFNIPGQNEI
jgi:hypothetical protein